jgi:hypothetical protein
VLAELRAELQPAARDRLTISVLSEHPTLPYMVVGNERRLVTPTYLCSTDSDDIACLELERSSAAATAVYDDFHKLADAGVPATLPPSTMAARAAKKASRHSFAVGLSRIDRGAGGRRRIRVLT